MNNEHQSSGKNLNIDLKECENHIDNKDIKDISEYIKEIVDLSHTI